MIAPSGRVLIVDDEPGMLRAAERVLAPTYRVATASRPSEAIVMAREFDPDLAICDIRMPEMDGFQLAAAMRAERPDLGIIFMTGSSAEPDAALVKAIRNQAFYFIQKPFARQVLLTLVERCLELRRLRSVERAHTARLERELADARAVQRAMLPAEQAAEGRLEVAAVFRACHELGGDFLDYALSVGNDGQRLAFVVADACGHGASAALLTAIVKTAFRSAETDGFDPVVVTDRLYQGVRNFGSGRFITAICGRLDVRSRRLEYVNAGHPPGVLLGDSGLESISPTNALISPDLAPERWESRTLVWDDRSRMLLCTDGLGDALGLSPGRLAGRLGELVSAFSEATDLTESVLTLASASLAGRPAPDDISFMAVYGR